MILYDKFLKIKNHFSESEETTFFSSQLLSSFQIITSQNQIRITSPDFTAFNITHIILPKNQKLETVSNRTSIYLEVIYYMYIQLSTNLGWRALLKDIWTCKNRTKNGM
jgi:hypothetical protein